jgi:hypothetical protein
MDVVRGHPGPVKRFSVRRLAAIDMWGNKGSPLRRRLILVEFLVGALGGVGLGVLTLVTASDAIWIAVGIWLVGVGLNYVPLAFHAISLTRRGELERELAGVDIRSEIRLYTKAQFRLLVPLWLAILAFNQRRSL